MGLLSINTRHRSEMKTTAILFVSLAVIYASAQEADVPEDSPLALDDDLSEARETLASMQASGKSEAACRKLVADTKNEITTNVRTEQLILDGLSKGHECSALKKEADDEKVEQKRTEDKEKAAKAHLDAMTKATVTFGSRSFSSVKKGDCSWIFSHSSYTTAKANYKKAVTAHQESQGAAAKAVEETKKAVAAAKKATKECNCKTQFAHATANKNSKRNDAANEAAWNMAHRLECVLDKKTTCTVPACPTTTAPALAPGAAAESCPAQVTGGPAKMPTDPCAKYQAEKAANKQIAAALTAQVGFAPGSVVINPNGKTTLDKVAKILNQYAWMAVNIQGHSDAKQGARCTQLVNGRADSTKKYLASKGCANKMTVITGTCSKVRAITIGAQDTISAGAKLPKGCKA